MQRPLSRALSSEARRALRLTQRKAAVSRVQRLVERGTRGSYYAAAGAAGAMVLLLGGLLVREKVSGGSTVREDVFVLLVLARAHASDVVWHL